MKSLAPLLAAAVLAAPFLGACSSTPSGARQAEAAATTLDDLRGTLLTLKQDIQASSGRLDTLIGSQKDPEQDTKQAFAAFSKSVSTVEASAGKATRELDGLRKETEAYFAKWTRDSAAITDASLKKSAEKRQKSMASVLDDLGDQMGDVQEELVPFQTLLGEVRTYLGNDLSPAGLEAVRAKAKTLGKQARSLVGEIDDVLEEIDDGADSFRGA
jgi:uncharacterized protein YukE